MEKRTNRKLLCPGIILILFLAVICALVYKAQIRESLRQPIEYTMMTEHKDTFEVVLSKGMTAISEVFVCKVPELKSFSIELTGKNVVDEAELVMTLADADTKEIYFQKFCESGYGRQNRRPDRVPAGRTPSGFRRERTCPHLAA